MFVIILHNKRYIVLDHDETYNKESGKRSYRLTKRGELKAKYWILRNAGFPPLWANRGKFLSRHQNEGDAQYHGFVLPFAFVQWKTLEELEAAGLLPLLKGERLLYPRGSL